VNEPIWLDERDARALHEKLIRVHGGAQAVRDAGLLASALARPQQHRADAADADLCTLAAAYTVGIVRNHPFVDGNKRVGFVLGVLFLELNGARFCASQADAAQAVIALAAGQIQEAQYTSFLRRHCAPPSP